MDADPDKTTPDDPQRPKMEPLTPDERDAFLARVRAQGRTLTSAEQYMLFGPPPEPKAPEVAFDDVEEMEPARLDAAQLAGLESDFFPELGDMTGVAAPRLINGVIFDFDYTLAELSRPLDELLEDGARNAEAYMRSTGMDLPVDFYVNIIEARRFSQEKSEEENEEHIADDAMSFLLQFFGYPASQMDPEVLTRAVDIFYAPEMTAWRLRPGAHEMLAFLHQEGYHLALLANYNCDRVFQRIVDYLGIRRYFDLCISSAGVEFRKPDSQFFNLALDRWDLPAYEVVVVGDSLRHDIQGGIELGAQTMQVALETAAQVTFDNQALQHDVRPDAVVTTMAEIPPHIAAWAAA